MCMDDGTMALWHPLTNQPQSENEPNDALEAEQSSPEEPCTAGENHGNDHGDEALQQERRCNKRDHGDDHWKQFRKNVAFSLKKGIDLASLTTTSKRETFVIDYLQTKIRETPGRSLTNKDIHNLWDACMVKWKRHCRQNQTEISTSTRSEFFRAGMSKVPESVQGAKNVQKAFTEVNRAYWNHQTSERRMTQIWAERNSGDVGAPSTAGSVSDQGSVPAPETPPKATGSIADNERCATTPTLVGCKKDPPMSAVKECTIRKSKRSTIIGATRRRARRVKAKDKKPSTAGSDQNTRVDHQGGALLCAPDMDDGEDPLEYAPDMDDGEDP